MQPKIIIVVVHWIVSLHFRGAVRCNYNEKGHIVNWWDKIDLVHGMEIYASSLW